MKRPHYLILSISAMIITGFFLLQSFDIPLVGTPQLITLSVIFLLAVIFAAKRFGSWKHKEPVEDEYSKKIMMKTASYSYYISLYLWLFISFLSGGKEIDTQRVIGLGVVGMAVVFVISWVFVKLIGLRNE